jgi:hypothetical protein
VTFDADRGAKRLETWVSVTLVNYNLARGKIRYGARKWSFLTSKRLKTGKKRGVAEQFNNGKTRF